MTQVDHEHIVRYGGDAKVACETLIGAAPPDPKVDPYVDPDMPAESTRIRMDDDSIADWLDNIHPVYERDDSTKGTTNPKSQLHAYHQNPNPNSQRFSGNLKATTKAHIIGLPGAGIQHSTFVGHSARRQVPPIFPRNGGKGKLAGAVADPGSPKVSCFGKVLSDRDRRNISPAAEVEESAGCWSCFRRQIPPEKASSSPEGNIPARRSDARSVVMLTTDHPGPPGLGGMKRFVSGRRSSSWGGDSDDAGLDGREDGHVAWSGPLVKR